MSNEFLMAIILLVVVVPLVYFFSRKQSTTSKTIIWGITIMLVIAPLLSFLISAVFTIIENDGFAGIGLLFILFPTMFLIGLVVFFVGIINFLARKD